MNRVQALVLELVEGSSLAEKLDELAKLKSTVQVYQSPR